MEKEAREAKRGAWSGSFDIPFVQKRGAKEKVSLVSCPDFPIERVVDRADPPQLTGATKDGGDLPLWIKILTAMLAPAIACLAAVIAWAQWRVVRRREIMELFERRIAIYEALRNVVGGIVPTGKVTDTDLHDFVVAGDRARFLFGDDIVKFVDHFLDQLLKHQEAEAIIAMGGGAAGYQKAVTTKHETFKEITKFYAVFPKLLAPYVRMDQKSPWEFGREERSRL